MNRKMSNGEALACKVVVMFVFLLIATFINEATTPRCIKSGCDNEQASGSSYCYLHKLYSSSYSSGHKSSTSSSSSKSSSSSSSSSTKSSTSTTKKSNSSSSKKSSSSYSSYDDGYDDVYEDDDYDWDRYWSDDDYADGVNDAMDELDW